jgi:hypothetical protein
VALVLETQSDYGSQWDAVLHSQLGLALWVTGCIVANACAGSDDGEQQRFSGRRLGRHYNRDIIGPWNNRSGTLSLRLTNEGHRLDRAAPGGLLTGGRCGAQIGAP